MRSCVLFFKSWGGEATTLAINSNGEFRTFFFFFFFSKFVQMLKKTAAGEEQQEEEKKYRNSEKPLQRLTNARCNLEKGSQ